MCFYFSKTKQTKKITASLARPHSPSQHKINVKTTFMVHFPFLLNKSKAKDTFSGSITFSLAAGWFYLDKIWIVEKAVRINKGSHQTGFPGNLQWSQFLLWLDQSSPHGQIQYWWLPAREMDLHSSKKAKAFLTLTGEAHAWLFYCTTKERAGGGFCAKESTKPIHVRIIGLMLYRKRQT